MNYINKITNAIYKAVDNDWCHGEVWDSEALVNPPKSDFYTRPNRREMEKKIQALIKRQNLDPEKIWKEGKKESNGSDLVCVLGSKMNIKNVVDCSLWCKTR